VSLPLLLAALPLLYWPQGVDTAPALKQAGIERIGVPPAQAAAWREAGFAVVEIPDAERAGRTRLPAPGVVPQARRVSATQSPWVTTNAWRFLRDARARYRYELPAGRAALAAAEAFAYGADALLEIDQADLGELGRMLAFLAELPAPELPPLADFGVLDDGTPVVGEVMNLLLRRNLVFAALRAPDPRFAINVKVGSKEYPTKEALDPSAFALKIRRQLGDEQRSLRLYGSEGVIARLTGDEGRRRLHLLNYGGRDLEGLRARVRGAFPEGEGSVSALGRVGLEERVVEGGFTEFSLPRLGVYTVVDLRSR
jgi:hypothetical protein